MFDEWTRQRLKLSQLLIWERVIRTMDLHHPVNAISLQTNLRVQGEVMQAIEEINRKRGAFGCLEDADKNQGHQEFCSECGKLLEKRKQEDSIIASYAGGMEGTKTVCVDCYNVYVI